MALPSLSAFEGAIATVRDVFTEDLTNPVSEQGMEALNEVVAKARQIGSYGDLMDETYSRGALDLSRTEITVTDATYADLNAFFASDSELGILLGRAPIIGEYIKVGGTGDTTDNALAGAKGSGVVAGDVFKITGPTAVSFIGNEA